MTADQSGADAVEVAGPSLGTSWKVKNDFLDLGVDPDLVAKLASRSIVKASPVQLSAIPTILSGSDTIIDSHTGTGKTLAYILPILQRLQSVSKWKPGSHPEVLVVAPTRELAMQIFEEFSSLIAGTSRAPLWPVQQLIGGANAARQIERLRKVKPRIVVGTPGRINELLSSGKLKSQGLKVVVLDEVDHLMSDSYRSHIYDLLSALPNRQLIFASATIQAAAQKLADQYMDEDKVHVNTTNNQALPPTLRHTYVVCEPRKKAETLKRLMVACTDLGSHSAVAFVNSNRRIDELVEYLSSGGNFRVRALHGDATKEERGEALRELRQGRLQLVVCTEMGSRGLDLPGVSHVFNLDLPTDALHYVHRAGRTGRLSQSMQPSSRPMADARPRDDVGSISRGSSRSSRSLEETGQETGEGSRTSGVGQSGCIAWRGTGAGSNSVTSSRTPNTSSRTTVSTASSNPRPGSPSEPGSGSESDSEGTASGVASPEGMGVEGTVVSLVLAQEKFVLDKFAESLGVEFKEAMVYRGKLFVR